MRFEELILSERIRRAVNEVGYTELTPIQEKAIPLISEGVDVMAQAQTGSGKTAAFVLPILQKTDPNRRRVQAVILNPTRELAMQTAAECEKLGRYTGIGVTAVYGGQSIELQARGIQNGTEIVVGTPGRVKDLVSRGLLKLNEVAVAVLDEADEMLDMGFREDIAEILEFLPKGRQTLLFSATLPAEIRALAETYMADPEFVSIEDTELTVPDIEQTYAVTTPEIKSAVIALLHEKWKPQLTLIFCNTRHKVDEVTDRLLKLGVKAASLHGEMRQTERDIVMNRYRTGLLPVLVATDVAARGLDVRNVDLVVNYDLPRQMENYIHRIGRTARAGKSGRAVSLVTQKEYMAVKRLQEFTGRPLNRIPLPHESDLADDRLSDLLRSASESAATGISARHMAAARDLIARVGDPEKVAGALIKMVLLEKKNRAIPEEYPDGELPFGRTRGAERDRKDRRQRREAGEKKPYIAKDRRFGDKGRDKEEKPFRGHREERREKAEKPFLKKDARPASAKPAREKKQDKPEESFYGSAARRKALKEKQKPKE